MSSDDVYTCKYCGKPNYKKGNFCSCGKPKFDKFENKFNCPNCGKRIKDYADFCENCGSIISKDIYISYRHSKVKKCSKCGTLNDIDAKICYECGEKLPLTTESHLIECPGCGNQILDDVNYCRHCGYDFKKYENKSSDGLGFFAKKIKSSAGKKRGDRRCYNCNTIHARDNTYCNYCGSAMPTKELYPNVGLTFEEYKLELVNKFIVPLSKRYQVNFRKTRLRDYFNLTEEQEKHIIYIMMESIKEDSYTDILKLFESVLKQTKENFENLDKVIFDNLKEELTNEFNLGVVSAEGVYTIKDSYYETIETPVVQNKHGGVTKGVATLGFGLIGLAATSGVKTTMETQQIFVNGEYLHYQINFNKEAIILKTYDDESPELTFDSEKPNINQIAVLYENIHTFNSNDFSFILKTGETFKCPSFEFKSLFRKSVLKIVRTYDTAINNDFVYNYSDKLINKSKVILSELIKEEIEKVNNPKDNIQQQNNSNVDGLEKVVEMYEKGLLTDEEFATMKQNIIVNTKNIKNENDIDSVKFCGNCGAKIIDNSNFCTQCGNKLN